MRPDGIDVARAHEVRLLLGDGYEAIVARFAADARKACAMVAAGGPAGALRAAVHGVKGAARNLGAGLLAAHAERLEQALAMSAEARLDATRVLPPLVALRGCIDATEAALRDVAAVTVGGDASQAR
jgi:HPt (histidine-containing phosphotransfer) domain-containing protein